MSGQVNELGLEPSKCGSITHSPDSKNMEDKLDKVLTSIANRKAPEMGCGASPLFSAYKNKLMREWSKRGVSKTSELNCSAWVQILINLP